jgi:translation elongation factor P/translation initiation factor 5A
MKKTAVELKKGDMILVANQECLIEELEISDIGKQGKRKVRVLAKNSKEEKIVLIRPEDYPFEFIR